MPLLSSINITALEHRALERRNANTSQGSYWAHPDVLLHVAQRFIGASQGYLRPAGEYTDRSRRSTAVNDLHAVRTPADVFRTYCRDILRLYKALLRAGALVQSIPASLLQPPAPSQAPLPFNFAAVAAATPSLEEGSPAPDAQLNLAQLQGLARALACPAAPVSRPKRGAWERLAAGKRECLVAMRLGACRQAQRRSSPACHDDMQLQLLRGPPAAEQQPAGVDYVAAGAAPDQTGQQQHVIVSAAAEASASEALTASWQLRSLRRRFASQRERSAQGRPPECSASADAVVLDTSGAQLGAGEVPLLAVFLSAEATCAGLSLRGCMLGSMGLHALLAALAAGSGCPAVLDLALNDLTAGDCEAQLAALLQPPAPPAPPQPKPSRPGTGASRPASGPVRMESSLSAPRSPRASRPGTGDASPAVAQRPGSSLGGRLPLAAQMGRLEELGLAGNLVRDPGAAALASALSSGRCTLKRLDLSRCGLSLRSAVPLAAMLQANAGLEALLLAHNALGARGAEALCSALTRRFAEAGGHSAGAGGAAASVGDPARRRPACLAELDLAWNGLGDAGASALATALRAGTGLLRLDISGNAISWEACGALGEALQAARLERLAAAGNPLGRDGARRLLRALCAGHMQHLNIRRCSLECRTAGAGQQSPEAQDKAPLSAAHFQALWQDMASPRAPGMTDAWRQALLHVLLLDHALSAAQALAVAASFAHQPERAAGLGRRERSEAGARDASGAGVARLPDHQAAQGQPAIHAVQAESPHSAAMLS